jgi:hypothetical protein
MSAIESSTAARTRVMSSPEDVTSWAGREGRIMSRSALPSSETMRPSLQRPIDDPFAPAKRRSRSVDRRSGSRRSSSLSSGEGTVSSSRRASAIELRMFSSRSRTRSSSIPSRSR